MVMVGVVGTATGVEVPMDGESKKGDGCGLPGAVHALTSTATAMVIRKRRQRLSTPTAYGPTHSKQQPLACILTRVTRRSVDLRLDEILSTACDVIADRGLANTRTADVARAAGVSQALMFYHFDSKDRLLVEAFTWAAEQDLTRLETILVDGGSPLNKLRRILRWYAPTGSSKSWPMWIDCWSESMRVPELEKVSRRLDIAWKDALAEVITLGVKDGEFECEDPTAAAWRVMSLIDGLALQMTVHPRVISRKLLLDWVRGTTARELGIDADELV
jgi:AcrR family transcriptional regulator